MSRSTVLPASLGVARDAVRFPVLYQALRAPVRMALTRLFDLSADGVEYLPASGPYIVAANHHNYLDGLVLGATVPAPVAFLVMPRVYRATPLHPWLHRCVGSIPLEIARPDVGALRRALITLEAGGVVGIFPEGPFSVHGRLERGLPGVALLALRSGVPVVPAGIAGTYEALDGRRWHVPRRRPLAVRFGAPRRFPPDGTPHRDMRAAVTRRIMDDIAALLP